MVAYEMSRPYETLCHRVNSRKTLSGCQAESVGFGAKADLGNDKLAGAIPVWLHNNPRLQPFL
jgi:hypothetical protein